MPSDDARERILATAYELFSRRSVRDVGVGEVIERASVAKATLYRHFPSKDELVRAFLSRRGQFWTRDTLEAGARSRGSAPVQRLLALFDVLDDWFRSDDYESCSFVGVLLEMGPDHPLGRAAIVELDGVQDVVRRLAVEAGLHDPVGFAGTLQILINGSIVAAVAGDREAAVRARRMAQALVDRDHVTS